MRRVTDAESKVRLLCTNSVSGGINEIFVVTGLAVRDVFAVRGAIKKEKSRQSALSDAQEVGASGEDKNFKRKSRQD